MVDKRPVLQYFNLGERLFPVDDFGWWRIPDRDLAGGTGGRTISRIRLTYRISVELTTDSGTGLTNSSLIMALTSTSGNPAPFPNHNPLESSPDANISYSELPLAETIAGGGSLMSPAQGAVDAKGQRDMPAGPGGTAIWFGVAAYDLSGLGASGDIVVYASGFVLELLPR